MTASPAPSSSVAHSSFVIEREFAAPPHRVFRAWSDAQAKRRWFVCHDDMVNTGYRLDFRIGGSETNQVVGPSGQTHRFDAHFYDIVDDERIVYAYDMHVGATRLSVSLVTVQFVATEHGTRMIFTEQVAFLDGHQQAEERIHGTEEGFERLLLEVHEASTAQ